MPKVDPTRHRIQPSAINQAIRDPQDITPRSIIRTKSEARGDYWLAVFKAMSRRDFLAYPTQVRSFDDMCMAEYLSYRQIKASRDNDRAWEWVIERTEGRSAVKGTIQSQHKIHRMLAQAMENPANGPGEIERAMNTPDQRTAPKIKAVRAKIKTATKKGEPMKKLTVKNSEVTFLGKKYPVSAGETTKVIDGVTFGIEWPRDKAGPKKGAKTEPKTEAPAEKAEENPKTEVE